MAQDSPEYRPEVEEAGLKEKDPNHRPAVDIEQNFNRRLNRRRCFERGRSIVHISAFQNTHLSAFKEKHDAMIR